MAEFYISFIKDHSKVVSSIPRHFPLITTSERRFKAQGKMNEVHLYLNAGFLNYGIKTTITKLYCISQTKCKDQTFSQMWKRVSC